MRAQAVPRLLPLLSAVALAAAGCSSSRQTWRPYGTLLSEEAAAAEAEAARVEVAGLTLPGELPARLVLGAAVETVLREPLGALADLAFDPRDGHVLHVLVERLAHDALGSEPARVPYRELAWDIADGQLVARVTRLPDAAREVHAAGTGGDPRSVEGEVIDVVAPEDPAGEVLLKVRDDSNRYHRVLLAPAGALDAWELRVGPDARVRVEGLARRDARGMIVYARRVEVDAESFVLRDERGRPLWDPQAWDLAAARVSALELLGLGLTTEAGAPLTVRGFALDSAEGRVTALDVVRDGRRLRICWGPVRRGPEGRLVLEAPLDELLLPTVSE